MALAGLDFYTFTTPTATNQIMTSFFSTWKMPSREYGVITHWATYISMASVASSRISSEAIYQAVHYTQELPTTFSKHMPKIIAPSMLSTER